ncbi:MAG: Rv1535 family protein [Mycobacterium sp.]|jgi:hypothetical protein|uniref:Rv1535 family protein n=1 Tax=Mycobacterium sp. TaxID=1785 RepID=UPI00283E0018|nr:Rv1535 family protein [Mycobacterium sp.]HKI43608.1 Rv1535 family protein [Mycobacterium sp.]
MTALLHDDVVPTLPAPAPAPTQAKRLRHRDAGGDPLADAAARLLSIPLRHVYAVLWRVGLIEVTA